MLSNKEKDVKEIMQRKTAYVWLIAGTCLFLLIPYFATKVSDEVLWTRFDFLVMGALLLILGSLLIVLARKLPPRKFYISAIVVVLSFLLIWAELSVGIFFSLGS